MSQSFKDILSVIANLSVKPALFEPGEPHFWDDPHISKSMLEAHLNPTHYAASHLATQDFKVTGIDFSERSLNYVIAQLRISAFLE